MNVSQHCFETFSFLTIYVFEHLGGFWIMLKCCEGHGRYRERGYFMCEHIFAISAVKSIFL